MAKKFIALEETSQAIKTTVEDIQTDVESVGTAVNEIKEDVGDGAGTDLVTRVANLEAKIDALAENSGSSNNDYILMGTSSSPIWKRGGEEITIGASSSSSKTATGTAFSFVPKLSGQVYLEAKFTGGYKNGVGGTTAQILANDSNVISDHSDAANYSSIFGGVLDVSAGTTYDITYKLSGYGGGTLEDVRLKAEAAIGGLFE